jgi:Putative Flp pilus-assembly TadE/G-like
MFSRKPAGSSRRVTTIRSDVPKAYDRRGAVLPLVAITMFALVALLALAIDGGLLQRERRLAQNAADAGALAGAQEIFRNQTQDTVFAAARNETARNGFTHGSNHAKVTVDTLPTGDLFGGAKFVRVIVYDTVPTIFPHVLGREAVLVRAQAIGGIVPPSGNCMVALDPNQDKQTLAVSAGATLTASQCGIAVNSRDPDALDVRGNGSVLSGASVITVVGNYNVSSGGTITGATPQIKAQPAGDPLAYLTTPAPGPCPGAYNVVQPAQDTTLQAGVYCGGIKLGSSVNVTFAPGMYWLLGGGLDVGSSATANGTGVTFVNMNAPAADGGYNKFGIINFQSSSQSTLSAMTTGSLAGVLFYQDPTAGQPGHTYNNVIHSGAGSTFSGSLYFPTQNLTISSAGTLTINGGVVAQQIGIQDTQTQVVITGSGGGSGFFKLKRPSIVD